jgi:hypothetical protein
MVSTRFQRSLPAGSSQSCPDILFRTLLERVHLKRQETCFGVGFRICFVRRALLLRFYRELDGLSFGNTFKCICENLERNISKILRGQFILAHLLILCISMYNFLISICQCFKMIFSLD